MKLGNYDRAILRLPIFAYQRENISHVKDGDRLYYRRENLPPSGKCLE